MVFWQRSVFLVIIGGGLIFASLASAQGLFSGIQGAMQELQCGATVEACAVFCDQPDNALQCKEVGEKYGLIAKQESAVVKDLAQQGLVDDFVRCQQKPDDSKCIDLLKSIVQKNPVLAKKLDIGSSEVKRYEQELKNLHQANEGSDRFAKDLAANPGLCPGASEPTPEACGQICLAPQSPAFCETLAQKYFGAEGAKHLEAARRGERVILPENGGPGGCKEEKACRTYCDDPGHMEECINFAESHGFMSKEEAVRARKFAGKTGPGGCRGPSCQDYCQNPSHQKECFEFAKANNLLPEEDLRHVEAIQEVMERGGPGGCRAREECQAYCENADHRQECMEFGQKHGFGPPAGGPSEMMRGGMMMKRGEMMEAGGQGMLPPGCREAGLTSPEQCMALCKEQPEKCGGSRHESGPQSGPGGCQGKEECMNYCQNREEECQKFFSTMPGLDRGGDQPRIIPAPGGSEKMGDQPDRFNYCKDHPEECAQKMQSNPTQSGQDSKAIYCQEHPEECARYQQKQGPGTGFEPRREGFQAGSLPPGMTPETMKQLMEQKGVVPPGGTPPPPNPTAPSPVQQTGANLQQLIKPNAFFKLFVDLIRL